MAKLGIWGLMFSALLLMGCANKPYVSTDYDAGYNFAALKTFAIREDKSDSRENLLISPFTFTHIKTLLNSELGKRYQAVTGDAAPDFYVTYHIVMEEKLDPTSYDNLYGYGVWGRGYRRYPPPFFYHPELDGGFRVYTQGSLIIDMVDAKTQQPIWRGVSEKRLNQGANAQRQREILTSAVLEVISQFPPVK